MISEYRCLCGLVFHTARDFGEHTRGCVRYAQLVTDTLVKARKYQVVWKIMPGRSYASWQAKQSVFEHRDARLWDSRDMAQLFAEMHLSEQRAADFRSGDSLSSQLSPKFIGYSIEPEVETADQGSADLPTAP